MDRITILMGAGSVVDIGGLLTSEITNKILEASYYKDNHGTPIFRAIKRRLDEIYKDGRNLNFETIFQYLNVLWSYYYTKGHHNKLLKYHSVASTFPIRENEIADLFNYTIDGNYSNFDTKFYVPGNETIQRGVPEVYLISKYRENLLHILFDCVNYDFRGNVQVEKLKEIQIILKNIAQSNFLRMYTLNYDDLSQILNEDCGLNLDNGFGLKENIREHRDIYLFDKDKLMADRNHNCYYNLHGSRHWFLDNIGFNDVFKYGFGNLDGSFNRGMFNNSNPNTLSIVFPIITGYDKIQSLQVEPYQSFYYSFIRDVYESKKMLIIGYGFADPHINSVIKNNRLSKLSIFIIMKAYSVDEAKDFYSSIVKEALGLSHSVKTQGQFYLINEEENIQIYWNGFMNFIKREDCSILTNLIRRSL